MQNIILFRHAIAQPRQQAIAQGVLDEARELTEEGLRKLRAALQGLVKLTPDIDVVITSPLRRATQTAELLGEVYNCPVHVHKALSPGMPPEIVLKMLREHNTARSIICVGHEPDLSSIAGWLLTGKHRSFIAMKKSGACMLEFQSLVMEGEASLCWLATSPMLRAMRDRSALCVAPR